MNKAYTVLTARPGFQIYVRKDAIIRIWHDADKGTAIMYTGGITDHVKETVDEVLRRLK